MYTQQNISLERVSEDKPDESGAQTFTSCTRALCLPPTTFLFLWLQNEIHFACVEGTKQQNDFLSEMNAKYLI